LSVVNEPAQSVQPVLERAQRVTLLVGISGLVLSVLGLIFNPSQFFQSYLVAFLWVLGLSLGALGFSMIHYLGGGRWGAAIGDVLRSGSSLFWLLAILFIPIVVGIPTLYSWANPAVIAADPALQHKAGWFSIVAVVIRAIVYFGSWIIISRYLNRWFREWDQTGDPRLRRSLRNLSGGGLVVVVLTASFAMFDWVMSLEPDWVSTIFGLMLLAGHLLAGWALTIFVATRLRHWWPIREMASWQLWRDIGSLQLAMVIIWSYLTFDQFMLIWVGNLNAEIPWYLRRFANGWDSVAIFWVCTQFAISFLMLVQRGTRKSPVALGWVTLLLVLGRFIELIWLVEPDFPPVPLINHWQDLTLLLGLGGIWGTFYVRQLRARLDVVRPAAIHPHHIPVGAGRRLTEPES
jgi:hypothetical protein